MTQRPSAAWRDWRERVDLEEYDARWDRLAATGKSVHDEAELVDRLLGQDGDDPVLDAGCGTGRVAVELARRGRSVVGVDNDSDMLAYAQRKPESVRWVLGDLASVELEERFGLVVMAGNILPFVEPADRAAVVANLARHLIDGGLIVIGAGRAPGCGFDAVDRWCADAGLASGQQWSTWTGDPYDGQDYRVSTHIR